MLISYSMPPISAVGVTGGSWLTADFGTALYDGKPARRARLIWNAGTTVADYMTIPITFSSPSLLRVFALLGTSLPPGVRIPFVTPSGTSYGGTTGEAMTTYQPDQTTAAWAIGDLDAIADTGCTIRIYNDCNGTPWAAYGATFDLGEVWMGPAVELAHQADWINDLQDPSELVLTALSQPSSVMRSAYRTLDIPVVATSSIEVFSQGLANGMDWYRLQSALAGNSRCAVVVRRTPEFTLYQYGFGQLTSIRHQGGDFFSGQFKHQEVPAR